MKLLKKLIFIVPLSLILFLGFCNNANKYEDGDLLQRIISRLESEHYSPKPIDDKLSENVFSIYLKRLDNGKRFFTQSDINELSAQKLLIDDQLKLGSLEFFEKTNTIYNKRVEQSEKYYIEFLAKPFDFKIDEAYEFDEENGKYATSEVDQKENWRKYLKFSVLDRLYRKLDIQEKALEKNDTSVKQLPYDTLELKSRTEVLKLHQDWFKRMRKSDRKEKISLYANCIASYFDPHTNYFPPADKANFDIGITGRLEGIGATLSERDDQIKIERIVPGSASYRQGELKAGDIIIKVGQGAAEPIDVVGMKLDDAIKFIRGKKGTEVRLTVKRADGTQKVIPIVRDVVVIEEGYAKSSIVNFEGKKYGFIYLPQFYTDFNRQGGRTSSIDVANEVTKLKNEGVSGIILDLRNNGGGSLGDVVDMGGLFIKNGPICQVKSKLNKPDLLGDNNNDILYDGPLVIMVNQFSASASEIMAAAMQDYNRAIIIGTNSTFGKGTVQRFAPLDPFLSEDKQDGMGELKVTIQKFYRINGASTQLKGVIPDIILPSQYDYAKVGEKDEEYPLGYDEIPALRYTKWNGNEVLNFKNAIKNSQKRTKAISGFENVKLHSEWLGTQQKNNIFPLSLVKYKAYQKEIENQNMKFKDPFKSMKEMDVLNLAIDQKEMDSDTVKTSIRKEWNNSLKKDAYLNEAIQVLKDLN